MKIRAPSGSDAEPINKVVEAAENILGGEKIEKAFLFAPDALGEWLFQKYKDDFNVVIEAAPITVKLNSVLPTYTPVCYGSMFTGMKPEKHGIRKYDKPVLRCETIFDSLVKAGKHVAIVAVRNSSIDLIFRERLIDYYSEDYDTEVEERVIQILRDYDYDLILVYNQEYDGIMHRLTPSSKEALEAFKRHIYSFRRMSDSFNERNSEFNRLVAFLPDHGTHLDPENGKGAHGTSLKDDVEVRHFWGINSLT